MFAWDGTGGTSRHPVAAMVIVLPVLYTTAFGVLLVASGFVTLVALGFAIGTWLQQWRRRGGRR